VDAVVSGEGRLVLLAGEPGVGKTRLVQEITVAVRERGFLVAAGRCYEPEQTVPYYPFLDIVAALWDLAPEAVRADAATRWPYLGVLLPEELPVPPASASPGQDEQQRVFRAVTGFLVAMTEIAPIALVVDDLHWADGSSLTLLRHLATHTRSARILLLGSYRDVEVGRQHPLEGTLGDLHRDGLVERVDVRRLDLTGTSALVAATMEEETISREFAALVHGRTEGNPYFVQQVLRHLVERGDVFRQDGHWDRKAIEELSVPESIRSAVGQRLARLGGEAQELLGEASVLGQIFRFEDLAQMGEHAESLVEEALEEILGVGLVREAAGDAYAFDHALSQQVCYGELTARKRRRLHLAAGRALEQLPDRERVQRISELAWHFWQGDDREKALKYALQAGDAAASVFANQEAEVQYRRAVELAREREDRAQEAAALHKLGVVVGRIGRLDEACGIVLAAASAYESGGDLEAALGALEVGMFTLEVVSAERRQQILSQLRRLVESAPPEPSATLVHAHVTLAAQYYGLGDHEEGLRLGEQAVALAEQVDDPQYRFHALHSFAIGLLSTGRHEEGWECLERAVALGEETAIIEEWPYVLHTWGIFAYDRGDWPAARAALERSFQYMEERGDHIFMSLALNNLAGFSLERGEWANVERYQLQSAAVRRAVGDPARFEESFVAYFRLLRGDSAAAEELASLAVEAMDGAHLFLAEWELLTGQPERAVERLEAALAAGVDGQLQTSWQTRLAEARLACGDVDGAGRLIEAILSNPGSRMYRMYTTDTLRVLGMVRIAQERWEEAWAALDEGLRVAYDLPFRRARILHELGLMHAARGEPEDARTVFAEALTIFEELGARPYTERTEQALQSLGSAR
jgi:tetratricopeptide (TPR) repeat protein